MEALNEEIPEIVTTGNQICEADKRSMVFDPCSIARVLQTSDCRLSRIKDCQFFKCSGHCIRKLGAADEAFKSVTDLRQMFWIQPSAIITKCKLNYNCTGRNVRNCLLIQYLFNNLIEYSNGKKGICFRMAENIEVCKYFFRISSGIDKKKFDAAVSFVLNYGNDTRTPSSFDNILLSDLFKQLCGAHPWFHKIKRENILEDVSLSKCEVKKIQNDGAVLAFLDEYITREADYAPEKAEMRYIRQSWREVYNAYVESNKDLEIENVSYPYFTQLR